MTFKSYFLLPKKNNKKAEIFLKFAWNFFRHLNEMSQPSGQNQQNGKRTRCRLLPQSFRINFKDTPCHISMTPKGFIFSPEYFLIFFSNLYVAPWLRKIFKFMVLRSLENAFVNQKIESVHFYFCPQAKISPKFLSLPIQARGNYPFPPYNVFVFFLSRKGRGL